MQLYNAEIKQSGIINHEMSFEPSKIQLLLDGVSFKTKDN